MRLGEYLVSRRKISSTELTAALDMQAMSHTRLGDCLLAIKAVNQKTLFKALARIKKLAFVELRPLRKQDISLKMIQQIPYEVARRYQLAPLQIRSVKGKHRFVVATTEPDLIECYDELEFKVGMRVLRVITTPDDLSWFQRKFYRLGGNKKAPHSRPQKEEVFYDCFEGLNEVNIAPPPDNSVLLENSELSVDVHAVEDEPTVEDLDNTDKIKVQYNLILVD